MKYTFQNQSIPQEARQELNDKVLYLIDQDLAAQSGITAEDIFNAYTGDGGLHGLNYQDYANYYEYSKDKKEFEHGQFFTPPPLAQLVMEAIAPEPTDTVADLTAGMANFCNYMPIEGNFYGCELDVKAWKVSKYLYPKANLERGDIRFYKPYIRFDYVVGNPPFNLNWDVTNGYNLSQMYYCVKASELLKPLGIMAIIVPMSFLSDDFMDNKKIADLEKRFDFLGQVEVTGRAFKYFGINVVWTKIMFWQKRVEGEEIHSHYTTECVGKVEDLLDTTEIKSFIQSNILAKAQKRMKDNRARIQLMVNSGESDEDVREIREFYYEAQKMLYHIQSNPKLQDKYAKCQEILYRYEHQKCPEGMSAKEWSAKSLTPNKVLTYFRRVLRSQNKKAERDVVRVVKRDYDFTTKAYSTKTRRALTEEQKDKIPIWKYVTDTTLSTSGLGPYAKLIERKRREHTIETKPFSQMEPDPQIAAFLDDFTLYDEENEEWLHLNDMQKHDINLFLQKRYHLLQWEQGSGKTLAGIAAGQYRMKYQHARNIWVVSSAISIKNNWDVCLTDYGLPYRMIRRAADIDDIQDGEFVIITMGMLSKYKRQIKKNLRRNNQKVCLILDESDEMTNPRSKRTKAILDCFRRAKFKLAMTGTVTRNNIAESATQLELLYNNSYNLISRSEYIYDYITNRETGEKELVRTKNPYLGKPFPAYVPGYKLFTNSHMPRKLTVLGIEKGTQDIYNADILSDILGYAVITRTFEEVTGKDIKRLHQVTVNFSPEERKIYEMALSQFNSLRNKYFESTGNEFKDKMLELIQQLTLLLRISAAPNTMKEYTSPEAPVKIQKVMSMIAKCPDEMVVIGVRHKNVVEAYAAEARKRFPDRPLFVITGSTTTLAKRKALRKTLQASGNGILICTQQSLPSSVNFEFVNKVIIPELHWNNAQMSQFYHRFIRYTSTTWKDVYFVTYAGSIESNQMALVLAKEKLNLFMKGQNTDLDEVYERFGVDYDLMSLLMSKEKDEDGRSYIAWGSQKFVSQEPDLPELVISEDCPA